LFKEEYCDYKGDLLHGIPHGTGSYKCKVGDNIMEFDATFKHGKQEGLGIGFQKL